jgi:putative endonuclease
MTAHVYIVECSDGTLYTGWSSHWEKRIERHNKGRGSKYTRSRLPVRLVYLELADGKSEALRREVEIKNLSRTQKLKMAEGYRRVLNG